jgi:hypothetical protein
MRFPALRKDNKLLWHMRGRPLRPLTAWGVLVTLVLYIAISGPHRVHHIGEHDEQPDCLILFLTQHTPGDESLWYFPPILAPVGVHTLLQCLGAILTRPDGTCQARAPPPQHS